MTELAGKAPEHYPLFTHPRFVEGDTENILTLQQFTDGLYELQTTYPEIVGATLFGSRLKGRSTPESDVDCAVILDADQLAAKGIALRVNPLGGIEWGNQGQARKDYQQTFGVALAAKTGKDPSVITNGIAIQPISEGLISEVLAKKPAIAVMSPSIPALFSPDLIPGLDTYRKMVVDALASSGDYKDIAWNGILRRVKFGEGHYDLHDPRYYPVDLEQAQEWFGT